MLGSGEGLLTLRKVGDVTGHLVGAPSPLACELRHLGKSDCGTSTAPCVKVTLNQVLSVSESL